MLAPSGVKWYVRAMQKTLIQIYEVQKPKEAEALIGLGVDYIGSVIPDQSRWKNANIRQTLQAVRGSGAKSGLILLFNDPKLIFQALDYYQPDFVHFCEALSPFPNDQTTVALEFDALLSLQADVKKRFAPMEIMRSLSVPAAGMKQVGFIEKAVLRFAELFAPFSDYFLIDTLMGCPDDPCLQPVAGFVGITGKVCDWKIAGAVIKASPIPVILAGGLGDDNVFDAVATLQPAGVDSCTRTNAVDKNGQPIRFKKDLNKVRRFVEEVQRADRLKNLSNPGVAQL